MRGGHNNPGHPGAGRDPCWKVCVPQAWTPACAGETEITNVPISGDVIRPQIVQIAEAPILGRLPGHDLVCHVWFEQIDQLWFERHS